MLLRHVPGTNLDLSIMAVGTMQFGWTSTVQEAMVVLDSFFSAGGNLIDTADNYSKWAEGNSGGEAETIVGRWLATRGNREDVIIATKVGKRMWEGRDGEGLGRSHIIRACEDSLKRLGTDYIDLYQCHLDDTVIPLSETLEALNELVVCGKVRYIGCSNYSLVRLEEALCTSAGYGLPRFSTIQTLYNILRRSEVEEFRSLLRAQGVGLICYNTLAAGFLTGKYPQTGKQPVSARIRQVKRRFCTPVDYAALDVLMAVAREWGMTVGQVSLKWIISDSDVTSAIVGVNTHTQLFEAIEACSYLLSEEERNILINRMCGHESCI